MPFTLCKPIRGGIRQRRGLPEVARKLIGTTDSESIAVRENDRRGLVLFVYLSILEKHAGRDLSRGKIVITAPAQWFSSSELRGGHPSMEQWLPRR